jgi:hypothetical protein
MLQQRHFLLKIFRELLERVLGLYVLFLGRAYCFALVVVEEVVILGYNNFGAVVEKDACRFVR